MPHKNKKRKNCRDYGVKYHKRDKAKESLGGYLLGKLAWQAINVPIVMIQAAGDVGRKVTRQTIRNCNPNLDLAEEKRLKTERAKIKEWRWLNRPDDEE